MKLGNPPKLFEVIKEVFNEINNKNIEYNLLDVGCTSGYYFEIINFSFSAYSFEKDHLYQRESQNSYYNNLKGLFPLSKIKKVLKKITPNRLISFRQDLARIKVLRNDVKLNWFVNNTGDNCYIRGILRKN